MDEIAKEDYSYQFGGGKTSFRYYNQEESAWLVEQIKKVKTPFTRDENVWEILWDAAADYLQGTKNLDAAVDEVVSRIQMYLYEQ